MQNKTIIQKRLTWWESAHEAIQNQIISNIEGGVKSYSIDDKQLNRYSLRELEKMLEDAERKIDEYTALLNGGKPRKAFGIIPRDL